jgi:outer membrane protein TolC
MDDLVVRLRAMPSSLNDALRTMDEAADRIEALEAALQPFAQNVKAVSLSNALGHITREHLLNARAALDKDAGQ